MKKLEDYLKSKLNKDDAIVVAVSGGPDSMCLLDNLIKLRKIINFKIIGAHVNHNVRKQSADEQLFVQKYCESKDIIFEKMTIKDYTNDNFHNEARLIRYEFFEETIKKHNAKYLMTAHHGDDLIETVLMRLTRGSTFKGYAGFSKEVKRDDYIILRPLIIYSKKEIEQYNKENNIPFVTDVSNLSDKYTRNRYRKEILPFLKEEDENVHTKFFKFCETLQEYNKYIENIINEKKKAIYNNKTINLKDFNNLKSLEKIKLLELILDEIYNDDLALITNEHINNIIKLINSNKANSEINLPRNIVAKKVYTNLEFTENETKKDSYNIELDREVFLPNNHSIAIVEESKLTDNNCTRINSEELTLPLYVRTRKDGDRMYIKNMQGSKKIKDILIDLKIPIEERNSWPIVVDSKENIVWIPGLKKSKFDKEKNEKYDIIIKYI